MEVVLIDDDAEEAELFSDALSKINSSIGFRSFTDSIEALEFLIKCDVDNTIVFLDFNMRPTSGKALLKIIRQTPALTALAVVVYSMSISKKDIQDTEQFNVTGYLQKPGDFGLLVNRIGQILKNL